MAQIVARIDEGLAVQIDRLVDSGVVRSRSDAVRRALRALVERERRRSIGDAIVEGYRRIPQTEHEAGWTDDLAGSMIAEEPWSLRCRVTSGGRRPMAGGGRCWS